MAIEGDLRLFSLPDILQAVSHQQKTGILTVQGEQDILAVSFLQGEIVAADALNQNFEDGLGEVLASQGLVRPEDFALLSDEHRASGERFSEFLVQRGVLSRDQLLLALRVQTYRLLLQVLRWREGEFKFYSGDEVSYEEGMTPISVEEVLLRSVGDLVGEGTMSGTLPHGFVSYERLLSQSTLKVGARDAEAAAREPETIWITPDERVVLDHLDGHSTASEIAQASGLGEYKTLYALYRLLRSGLARPTAEPGSPESEPVWAPPAVPAPSPAPPAPAIVLPRESAQTRGDRRVAAGLAIAAARVGAWVVAAGILEPVRPLLPFPGQEATRAALEKQRRLGRYLAIDRAARTFYLLEGRYPQTLDELVARQLLPARSLRDPSRHPLQFQAEAETYRIRPLVAGRAAPELGVNESVAGDFLLDRGFFAGLREEIGVPLVLLD
jgi:hypothetical protein